MISDLPPSSYFLSYLGHQTQTLSEFLIRGQLLPMLSLLGGEDGLWGTKVKQQYNDDQDREPYARSLSNYETHLLLIINWEEKGYSGWCKAKTVVEVEKTKGLQRVLSPNPTLLTVTNSVNDLSFLICTMKIILSLQHYSQK